MISKILAALLGLLTVAACGGVSNPITKGPTASSVAVQQKDLPSGTVKCDLSGDINSFIRNEATPDPNTSKSTSSDWEAAKKKGATDAYVAFYTDSASHCAAIKPAGTDISTANYRLVVNFVVQFKDESSAAKGYTNDKIFGFSAAELRNGGQPIAEGAKTGLGPNSIVLSTSVSNQTFYIAVWQKKAFMVILLILNMDQPANEKVAGNMNNRIT
jgi:hypothetical protein